MYLISLYGDTMNRFFLFLLMSIFLFSLFNIEAFNKKEISIYIDPGHGGFDGGASGNDGTLEKDLSLSISLKLKDYFEEIGYLVYMTRITDKSLNTEQKNAKRSDIINRVNMINKSNCDLYLSIHLNAFSNDALYGAQTFYSNKIEKNMILAESVQNAIKLVLNNTKRVAKSINDKYLIDHTNKVGCLIEAGFLSNKKELELLKTDNYQDKLAFAIYIGVIEYLSRCWKWKF